MSAGGSLHPQASRGGGAFAACGPAPSNGLACVSNRRAGGGGSRRVGCGGALSGVGVAEATAGPPGPFFDSRGSQGGLPFSVAELLWVPQLRTL